MVRARSARRARSGRKTRISIRSSSTWRAIPIPMGISTSPPFEGPNRVYQRGMEIQPRFFVILSLLGLLSSCGGASSSPTSYSTPGSSGNYYAMDTLIQISVGDNNAGITSDSLFAIYSLYDQLADNTKA